MRILGRVGRGLAVVLGLVLLYVAFHWALIEVGREVIVLRTENDDGTWRESRLWIVEEEGVSWLHGDTLNRWMRNLQERPVVEVERGGQVHRYRAEAIAGPHPRIDARLREKYGLADRWVRFVNSDRPSTRAVRLERIDPE